MTARFSFAALALITSMLCCAYGHAADDRDIIIRKNGTKIAGYIDSETTAGVTYRTVKGTGGTNTEKINNISFPIVYAGMDSGAWAKGQSERDAGNFEAAAEFFNQLATSGSREWERVYGAMAEGESWELAKKYGDAAKAFAVVVNGFAGDATKKPVIPAHRIWLDAKYRLGMAYAQAKNPEAEKVAQELEALGKKEGLNAAESRANGIRAAKFAAEGNASKFSEFMKKTTLRAFDEPEVWFHFKLFCADAFRLTFKKNKDASQIYREILNGLGDDPARQAQISLGLGMTLMENDKDSALMELLKLDVLPFGSPDQKCEARYYAGRLLWESAQSIKANTEAMKDERKASFVKETERAARLVLSAAADGPAKNPNVPLAKALLASFGPDPDTTPKETAPKESAPKPEKKDAPKPK